MTNLMIDWPTAWQLVDILLNSYLNKLKFIYAKYYYSIAKSLNKKVTIIN